LVDQEVDRFSSKRRWWRGPRADAAVTLFFPPTVPFLVSRIRGNLCVAGGAGRQPLWASLRAEDGGRM